MKMLVALLAVLLYCSIALAGHSRHPYCDGGQSADGRFVVTPKLIESPAKKKGQSTTFHWEFTWLDRQENRQITGQLAGLRSGNSAVLEPVHAHIFVAPDGETFAVWNPQVMAPTDPTQGKPPADRDSHEHRHWAGFSHRLVVYRKTGEIVRQLDLHDFLSETDWDWLFCYGRQVYWQLESPGLTRDNAPRVGYALYQISPDYTVLSLTIGATAEAARKAAERGITPPAPRQVWVNLVTGKFLAERELPASAAKKPGRPFLGGVSQRGDGGQASYVPSLDPVRVAGHYSATSTRASGQ